MSTLLDSRYEVVAELGRGGMGVVYRARDVTTGRDIALKVTLGRIKESSLIRFQREGELTARLNHPGIVRVHASGSVDGRPYLAYELVDGKSFSEVIDDMKLRPKVSVVRDAARALGHAHGQGIVHRDVKAENVLVDQQGRGRVADFGLAIAQDVERLTKTGTLLGTPSYMSPEQVDGQSRPPSPSSDVWSLGVLLYLALTETLPFQGGSMIEMVGKIMSGVFDRPRSVKAGVPRGLEQICLRALSPRPVDRYADGEAMAKDLDAWLEGTYVVKRDPTIVLGVALLAVALAGGGLLGWALTRDTLRPSDAAEAPPTVEPETPASPTRAPTDAELRAAKKEFETLKALPPEAQVRGAEGWLSRYSTWPTAERAIVEEFKRAAQLLFPVQVLRHSRSGKRHPAVQSQKSRAKGVYLSNERVLTQGADLKLRCWDLSAPAEPEWMIECGHPVTAAIAAHPGGKDFVISMGPDDGDLRAMDLATRTVRQVPGIEGGSEIRSLGFTPDGETLIIGGPYFPILLYRWSTLERYRELPMTFLRDFAVSPNGKLLAAVGGPWTGPAERRSSLRVWNLETGAMEIDQIAGTMRSQVAFHPDGESLVVGTQAGELFTFRLDTPGSKRNFLAPHEEAEVGNFDVGSLTGGGAHGSVLTGIAFSRDGRTLFSTSTCAGPGMSGEFRVWDYWSGEHLRELRYRDISLISLDASPDGKHVAVGTGFESVEIHLAQGK